MDMFAAREVVYISNRTWTVHCGYLGSGDRGPPLKEVLDAIVPGLPSEVDVYVPFGMHDGVQNVKAGNWRVPVLGAVYHPLYSPIAVPFAMGCQRSPTGYVNTPVVGWDRFVKQWLTCSDNDTRPLIKKAVFRGKAVEKATKYGTCTNACSWEDNGRLLVHKLGEVRPDMFDTWVSNAAQILSGGVARRSPSEAFLPLPDQLCRYQAVLNVGSNADWAERLRQSFYGNAIVMVPENPPSEFFTSFMEPWRAFWPIKSDLSDVVEQVSKVMSLANATRQLQAQRNFTSAYLTEEFMYYYDKLVVMEYDERVKAAAQRQGPAQGGGGAAAEARSLLRLGGCRSTQRRSCPGDDVVPPAASGWR